MTNPARESQAADKERHVKRKVAQWKRWRKGSGTQRKTLMQASQEQATFFADRLSFCGFTVLLARRKGFGSGPWDSSVLEGSGLVAPCRGPLAIRISV